ncbi:MAG: hypothetical protein ACI9H8_001901 [Lysobacterales bacterium]|jgi:hypothetical protein
MNWEAISTVAEVLGAAGVIITVIYLAVQVRQNTRFVQAAAEQALMSQEIEVYALTASHAGIFRRGNENLANLDPDEKVVFEHLLYAEMSQIYSGWVQFNRKLIPLIVWEAYQNSAMQNLREKGFRQAWNENKLTYPVDFQEAITKVLERDDAL